MPAAPTTTSVPVTATTSSSSSPDAMITLIAAIVGSEPVSVTVDLNASIPTLLDALEVQLFKCSLPIECTAYTTKRGDAWLHIKSREYMAIVDGGESVVATYCTAAARLDPSKTVHDYFRDAPTSAHVHVVLQWSPAAQAERAARRAHRAAIRAAREARRAMERQQEAECTRQALQATMETLRFRATTTTKATAPPRDTPASWWRCAWGSPLSSEYGAAAHAGGTVARKTTKAD